jgi:predicted ester cyclase
MKAAVRRGPRAATGQRPTEVHEEDGMRRLLVPLALVLALATGAVVAETRAALEAMPIASTAGPRTEDLALVRDWYAAANRAIATGDASVVSTLLAPGFVDHAVPSAVGGDAAALTAYLSDLHSTHPGARLVPLDVAADGDRVVVRVRTEGAERGAFLGLPIADARVRGSVDVFRIAGGGIAEHWGDGQSLARFAPLLSVPMPVPSAGGTVVALARRTYPPGTGELAAVASGFAVVLVQSGGLQFAPDQRAGGTSWRLVGRPGSGAASAAISPGTAVALRIGEALLLGAGATGTIANAGEDAAVALVVSGADADAPGWVSAENGGRSDIVTDELAGGQWVALPAGSVLAIGQATLPAGASVARHPVAGAELLSVEAGELALTTDAAGAWVHQGPGGRAARAETAVLGAGDGALIGQGAVARYLSVGDDPLALLLVTIAPGGAAPAQTTLGGLPHRVG